MPGVALKNVAILPFTLAGIDVICVAVRTTSQKTNVRLVAMPCVFVHFLRQLRIVGTIIYRGSAPNISCWCLILRVL